MDFIVKLLLNAIAVVITAYILPGVQLQGFEYAILLAAVLALLNVSIKPVLLILTIPATVLTLGLFILVINAVMILIADWIIPAGFNVNGFWWAFLFSIVLSIINSIFDRLTVKPEHRKDAVQIFDKDGNRVV